MAKYYYEKSVQKNLKKYLRFLSVFLLFIGLSIIAYVLFPVISWQIYFRPSEELLISIPKANFIDLAKNITTSTNYDKAENWFTNFTPNTKVESEFPTYEISIPKIKIEGAIVSTVDSDLEKHLVNYKGTSTPGKNGNTVIFGHSTLPQLFNPKDYKTIFANVYKLKSGDEIFAKLNNITYTYKIFKTIIVDPSDSSALAQDFDDSYLTLVTCTPPGTVWKRLVIKARIVNL